MKQRAKSGLREEKEEPETILCVGADLTGKTTLVNYLAQETWSPTMHFGKPPAGWRHWDLGVRALLNRPLNTIYDRLIIDSLVYGPMMKDPDPVTPFEVGKLQSALARLDAVMVIFCDAPDKCLEARFNERGDDYVSLSQILEAARQFRTISDEWKWGWDEGNPIKVFRYFSDSMTPESFYDANSHAIYQATLNCLPPSDGLKTDWADIFDVPLLTAADMASLGVSVADPE